MTLQTIVVAMKQKLILNLMKCLTPNPYFQSFRKTYKYETGEKISIEVHENNRKYSTGYILKYSGGAVFWESRTQRTLALFTTQAECMDFSEASKDTQHLRRFLHKLSVKTVSALTVILCDNQSA